MPENSEMIVWVRQKNKHLTSFVCFQISGFNDDVNTQKRIFQLHNVCGTSFTWSQTNSRIFLRVP